MDKDIIVALITGGAVILAALLPFLFKREKKSEPKETKIIQNQSGNESVQIGIQNNYGGKKDE